MALQTETVTYSTQAAAERAATAYRIAFRGYDSEAYVYQCNLTGAWVVNASRYLSCD
jgi:hypothetical protein